MRIEYENKFSDVVLFHAIHQFLSLRIHGLYLLLIAFIFWNESRENSIAEATTTTLFWYVGLWIFQVLFIAMCLASRKNYGVLTKHSVEVQEDAFFEETRFNKSFSYWPGVVKAVLRPGFVAVYVTPHQAHVIPNRSFASRAQKLAFFALVRDKIRAAASKL
jgi:hypothetical protein